MRYHVTLTTRCGTLTAEIPDRETLDSTLRWIERLRRVRLVEPVLSWVTVDGRRYCLSPADIDGDVQVLPLETVAI